MFGYILFLLVLWGVLKSSLHYKERVLMSLLILICFSSLRYGIGYDYYMYYDLALHFGESGIREVEPIPSFLLLLSSITSPFLFFWLSSIIIYSCIIGGLVNVSKNNMSAYSLTLFFFIGFPYFYFSSLGIIRQFMAFSIIFLSISKFKNNYKTILLLIFIAFLCHRSAAIAVLILVPWHKMGRNVLFSIFVLSFLIGEYVVSWVLSLNMDNSLFNGLRAYLILEDMYKGGSKIRILVYLFTIVSLIKYKKIVEYNSRNAYYISLVCIGACFQSILSISPHLAIRMCTFFFIASLAYFFDLIRSFNVKRWAIYSICIISLFYYIYVQHVTTYGERREDPRGYTNSYPYRTYFEIMTQ